MRAEISFTNYKNTIINLDNWNIMFYIFPTVHQQHIYFSCSHSLLFCTALYYSIICCYLNTRMKTLSHLLCFRAVPLIVQQYSMINGIQNHYCSHMVHILLIGIESIYPHLDIRMRIALSFLLCPVTGSLKSSGGWSCVPWWRSWPSTRRATMCPIPDSWNMLFIIGRKSWMLQ